MRPLEFYRLGATNAPAAGSEAEQRTVVGRLYYGLHHEACCRFFRENPNSDPLDRARRHTDLKDRYNLPPEQTSKTVAVLLNDLRFLRTQADYELTRMRYRGRTLTGQQLVNTATTLAAQLLQALENYSPGEAEDGCNCLCT